MISLDCNPYCSYIGSMDSCKNPKRLLDLEPCDEEAEETDLADACKRQRKGAVESSGDDFKEFVALIERIQYMKSNQSHRNFDIREETDARVIKTKPPHMPSFQWEDFCVGKDTVPAQKDIYSVSGKDNQSSYEEKGKQSIQPANHLKMGSSSNGFEKRAPAESFDLNVEASSNV